MTILKTCLKAGHRWGVRTVVTVDDGPDVYFVSRCQRATCPRLCVTRRRKEDGATDIRTVSYDDNGRGYVVGKPHVVQVGKPHDWQEFD